VDAIKALNECQPTPTAKTNSTHLETLLVFLLLFVDNAEAEKDFVGLVEILIHTQDARKGFFGVLERAITVIENSDAVPQLRVLKLLNECKPCYAWI
jgi:hypothetical protein